MSEKLAELAHKIDFSKAKDEDVKEDESDKPLFQPSLWPWDSVRNKLRYKITVSNKHLYYYLSRDVFMKKRASFSYERT